MDPFIASSAGVPVDAASYAAAYQPQQKSSPYQGTIYEDFDLSNVVNDFNPSGFAGVLDKVVTAPLKVFGLADRDFPFTRAIIEVKDGIASVGKVDSLDDPKGDKEGDKKARAIGEIVANRYNELSKANGTYGKPGVTARFSAGSASGRKGSNLGKGFYIGTTEEGNAASFAGGATYKDLTSHADFASSVDKYIADQSGWDTNFLPAWGSTNIPGVQIGKIDNTSPVAKMISGIAISAAAGAGFNALANSVSGAGTAGGFTSSSLAGTPSIAQVAGNAITPTFASGVTAAPVASSGLSAAIGGAITPTFASGVTAAPISSSGLISAAGKAITPAFQSGVTLPPATASDVAAAGKTSVSLPSSGTLKETGTKVLKNQAVDQAVSRLLAPDPVAISAGLPPTSPGVNTANFGSGGTSLNVKSNNSALRDKEGNKVFGNGGLINTSLPKVA